MTTAQDQQSRAAYEDGKWYWVEKESWVGQPPTVAPACYRADCDAWYSYVFSGITTRYLKVLEPCEMQAARALPAGMEPALCQRRMRPTWRDLGEGWTQWEDCTPEAAADYERTPVLHDWKHEVRRLYTAPQVQAMGRVPPGWQAVPVDLPDVMVDAFENAMEAATTHVRNFRAAYSALLAAAPRPPAAQEHRPLTNEQIREWWASENGLEDCDMGKLVDFTAVVRAIEAAHGITGGSDAR